jgi:hypothetical protein
MEKVGTHNISEMVAVQGSPCAPTAFIFIHSCKLHGSFTSPSKEVLPRVLSPHYVVGPLCCSLSCLVHFVWHRPSQESYAKELVSVWLNTLNWGENGNLGTMSINELLVNFSRNLTEECIMLLEAVFLLQQLISVVKGTNMAAMRTF